MQTYYICPSTWRDMDSIQLLSANNLLNNPLANHLLTTTAPPHPSRPPLANTDQSRHELSHYIYLVAYDAQAANLSFSKVMKAVDAEGVIHACAWLEWIEEREENGEEEDEEEKVNVAEMPESVNEKRWRWVERVKRDWRRGLAGSNGYYLIRTLDIFPNPIGYAAARALLARIDNMDDAEPVLVLTKPEHASLFTELDWWDAGDVPFEGVDVLGERGKTYCLKGFMRDREGVVAF